MECICPILERRTIVDLTRFSRDSWSLVQCRETGFVFLPNPPAYGELENEFAWEKTFAAERERRETQEPAVSIASRFAKAAKRVLFPNRKKIASLTVATLRGKVGTAPLHILDVGCGAGKLMVEIHDRFAASNRTVVLYGIEVSRHLASVSADRISAIGGKVICRNAVDGIADFGIDSIHVAVMSSFLEHESQPLRLLKRLHPVLTSDGAIILKVPNFACWNRIIRGRNWCGFRFPDHVNYFTPAHAAKTGTRGGLFGFPTDCLGQVPVKRQHVCRANETRLTATHRGARCWGQPRSARSPMGRG